MGRPPSNGGPSFRFMQNEVTEMEAILQEYHNTMPAREVLVSLAQKFSESPDRKGKIQVQMKQVWNWFQNRRYAIRAKSNKSPMKLNITPMIRDDSATARGVPQQVAAPIPGAVPAIMPASSAAGAGRATSENSYMEFEAKSARDGAWYDVGTFLSHRYLDKGDPEVLVRFAGFGPDEDEWLNVRKFVRQRSLPCEASECVAVLPADLILCFQEGKDQALYFDAHVLDAQRRRHDVRGCRCRFLVRYDHDQSEEIVPLRKICRRPETDYRLLQLHAASDTAAADPKKTSVDPSTANAQRVAASAAETTQQQQHNIGVVGPAAPVLLANVPQQYNAGVGTAAPVSLANVPQPAKTIFAEPKKAETPSAVDTGNPSVVSTAGFPSVTATAAALASGTAPSSGSGGSGENKQGIML